MDRKPRLGIREFAKTEYRETFEDLCKDDVDQCLNVNHSRISDDTKLDDYLSLIFLNDEGKGLLLGGPYKIQALSEDQLLLLPYCVPAFSLKSRTFSMTKSPCL